MFTVFLASSLSCWCFFHSFPFIFHKFTNIFVHLQARANVICIFRTVERQTVQWLHLAQRGICDDRLWLEHIVDRKICKYLWRKDINSRSRVRPTCTILSLFSRTNIEMSRCRLTPRFLITSHRQTIKIIHRWAKTEFVEFTAGWTNANVYFQMNDNYNGMMDDSPNRQNSPTNRSSTPSRTNARSSNNSNHMNHQTTNSNNSHQTNNGTGSPHSPLNNDSMLTGGTNYDNMNCDNLRSNLIMGSSALDGALLNGVGSGNGINDIMLGGGLGSDSSSKLITSSSSTHPTTLMMSQISPSHHLNNTQTTTGIPEIILSGEMAWIDWKSLHSKESFKKAFECRTKFYPKSKTRSLQPIQFQLCIYYPTFSAESFFITFTLYNNSQTISYLSLSHPTADYSSGSEFAREFFNGDDNFLEMGCTELQMFENANIIDPTIEDSLRRDLF